MFKMRIYGTSLALRARLACLRSKVAFYISMLHKNVTLSLLFMGLFYFSVLRSNARHIQSYDHDLDPLIKVCNNHIYPI